MVTDWIHMAWNQLLPAASESKVIESDTLLMCVFAIWFSLWNFFFILLIRCFWTKQLNPQVASIVWVRYNLCDSTFKQCSCSVIITGIADILHLVKKKRDYPIIKIENQMPV